MSQAQHPEFWIAELSQDFLIGFILFESLSNSFTCVVSVFVQLFRLAIFNLSESVD
jgi:hypothetical protein